jgi:hypothetical protein
MIWLLACNAPQDSSKITESSIEDSQPQESSQESSPAESQESSPLEDTEDPFADELVSFTPGDFAGYGQESLPDVVLGSPEAPGNGNGSLDVLSLGDKGELVLKITDQVLIDGPGTDLLIFENPFTGWYETGIVGVSMDGENWTEWPCDAEDEAGGFPGCAGVALVYANSSNGIDPTDPDAAGGDRFDLGEIGVSEAIYIRVRDSGMNEASGTAGGFDMDALSVVNGRSL